MLIGKILRSQCKYSAAQTEKKEINHRSFVLICLPGLYSKVKLDTKDFQLHFDLGSDGRSIQILCNSTS